MKYLKLFEEYKSFKVRKRPRTMAELDEPTENEPIYRTKDVKRQNVKDPNEPFFNRKKEIYFNKKDREVYDNVEKLNDQLIFKKMGITDDLLNKLKSYFYIDEFNSILDIGWNKEYNYYYIHLHPRVRYFDNESADLRYFVDEKDYVVSFYEPDGDKMIKIRFDTIEEAINFLIECQKEKGVRKRQRVRGV